MIFCNENDPRGKIFGGIPKVSFMQVSQTIGGSPSKQFIGLLEFMQLF